MAERSSQLRDRFALTKQAASFEVGPRALVLLDTNLQYPPCCGSLLGILASFRDRVQTVEMTMHMKKQVPCDLQRAAPLGGTLGLVLSRAMTKLL